MNFTDFMRSCGVLPPDGVTPGKWVRCATVSHPRKKNAAVKLSDDGRMGWVQNFESGLETWKADSDHAPRPIDKAEIASRLAAKDREMAIATDGARRAYETAKPLNGAHPYLAAKELDTTGCYGLRVDKAGWLVIPMFIGGQVSSIQRIAPDGSKRFWPGARTKGAIYTLTRSKMVMTLFCEGLATGLTLFAALPDSRVIVTFNSGNLVYVASRVKVSGLCAVCADNDRGTESRIGTNPGTIAGEAASEALGCGLAIPDCKGTDFNDAAQEFLIEERQQRMFDKGFKRTEAMMRKNALARIRAMVMPNLIFTP